MLQFLMDNADAVPSFEILSEGLNIISKNFSSTSNSSLIIKSIGYLLREQCLNFSTLL